MGPEEGGLFARSRQTNPLGPCSEDVKSHVDETTKEALTALAYSANMSVSEYIRWVLQAHVHGHGFMLRLATSPDMRRAGSGPESDR